LLDEGEAEAIALAKKQKPDWLLIDERRLGRFVRQNFARPLRSSADVLRWSQIAASQFGGDNQIAYIEKVFLGMRR
jgi:hypothetical protein